MLEGFYTAAAGILMQERTLNVLTNNMVNARTPGFRVERVISSTFEQELLTRMQKGNRKTFGTGSPTRIVEEVPTRFDPSLLEETGRPYDLAIVGEGYFNIQGQDTQYLTRNGNFDLDEEGYLILPDVGRVLGEGGELNVKGSGFTVLEDGSVYDNDGDLIDRLLISVPGQEAKLEKYGNGLYGTTDMGANEQASGYQVAQKTLERSNIDLNREYTLAMEAQRTFQSCSNALKILDSMNQKTATQIASL